MAKSKYESHVLPYLDKISSWATAGATAKEIAGKLKISYSCFKKYLGEGANGNERYEALSAAFARACEVPDDAVEAALFKRATGFDYDEMTFETKWNAAKETFVEVCTKRVTKMVPPDPTSAMFWLTNRRGEKWKYKPQENGDEKGDEELGVILLPGVSGDG